MSPGPACELGMGQGVRVNMHATASSTSWCATDFNPSQTAFAQDLANASGVGAQGTRLYDEAFADFCHRTDLPDFSFIGIHGIWSWISDSNRAVLVDFVRRKLRVGGVLYISYNTQPGWAAMVPMRDLLNEHAHVMGVPGKGIASRIDASLAFADQLMACNPRYAQANAQIAGRLKRLKEMGHNYLAHEYFNRDWQPMSLANQQAHSIGELWELLQASAHKAPINFPQLIEAVMLLTGKGDLVAVQDAEAVHQLFLLAMQEGNTPAAAPDIGVLIEFVWATLLAQSQRILRDGKPMESPQDNIAELRTQAVEFITKRLPTLRHLQLLD